MAETAIPNMTRAARDRREADWQAGVDWCGSEHLVKRAVAAAGARDDEGRYLFLQGVAQTLLATGRDIAGIDVRKER